MSKYLPIVLPLILTLIASYILQAKIITNQEQVATWLSSFGPFIILVYAMLQIITVIIAPIGGFFLVLTMIALFGPGIALILAYLVTTPAYIINFLLARKYGRPLVIKIIGTEPLRKLDELVKDAGTLLLIITRVFQAGNFDYLSYIWGLTKISFKKYLIVNFLGGIPGVIISYLVIARFENLLFGVLGFYAVTVLFAGIALYLTHLYHKYH